MLSPGSDQETSGSLFGFWEVPSYAYGWKLEAGAVIPLAPMLAPPQQERLPDLSDLRGDAVRIFGFRLAQPAVIDQRVDHRLGRAIRQVDVPATESFFSSLVAAAVSFAGEISGIGHAALYTCGDILSDISRPCRAR